MAITKDTTTIPGVTVLIDTAAEGIAIDYSPYYERIATALENISASLGGDSTTVVGILGGLETSINSNLSTLAANSTTIKDLATGTGIHMVGPYDWLGYMSMYKLYVEDAGAIGLTKLTEYKDKVKSLPTLF